MPKQSLRFSEFDQKVVARAILASDKIAALERQLGADRVRNVRLYEEQSRLDVLVGLGESPADRSAILLHDSLRAELKARGIVEIVVRAILARGKRLAALAGKKLPAAPKEYGLLDEAVTEANAPRMLCLVERVLRRFQRRVLFGGGRPRQLGLQYAVNEFRTLGKISGKPLGRGLIAALCLSSGLLPNRMCWRVNVTGGDQAKAIDWCEARRAGRRVCSKSPSPQRCRYATARVKDLIASSRRGVKGLTPK